VIAAEGRTAVAAVAVGRTAVAAGRTAAIALDAVGRTMYGRWSKKVK